MSSGPNPLVLDSTVLSNFACSLSISWLTTTFSALQTAPAVENELRNGVKFGHDFLRSALEAVEDGEISVVRSSPGLLTDSRFPVIFERLDRGEAEAFIVAFLSQGTLVTDDRTARTVAKDGRRDVPITGSVGLLVNGIVRDELSTETADEWLNTWREERGYYAPVETVTEALPTDYSQDHC